MTEVQAGPGFDLVLKGGRLIDERNGIDGKLDIAVSNGRVAAVARNIPASSAEVRDVTGAIVTPGLIDIHTHVYHKATSLSVDPEMIAQRAAITTLVDAGSAGAGNYDGFRDYVMAPSPRASWPFSIFPFPEYSASTRGCSWARQH